MIIYFKIDDKIIGSAELDEIEYKYLWEREFKIVIPIGKFPFFDFKKLEKDKDSIYLELEDLPTFRSGVKNFFRKVIFYE